MYSVSANRLLLSERDGGVANCQPGFLSVMPDATSSPESSGVLFSFNLRRRSREEPRRNYIANAIKLFQIELLAGRHTAGVLPFGGGIL